jgi:hypothetical protein
MPTWKGIVGRSFDTESFRTYIASLQFSDWRPQFVVLHNTWSPRLKDWHKVPGEQRMRNLERYYRDDQHWSAGPHLFVADDLIWAFTPLITSGVHSPSWNAMSWGVEMVGDYETEPFAPKVRDLTNDALAILHSWRGLNPDTIRLHKEDPKTTHKTCPGKHVDKADIIAGSFERMSRIAEGEHLATRQA